MSHVKAGGTAKNVHNNAGQRLGVKRFGGQKVKNGEVLVRQTGATKLAGPGTYMSRNFTIHAAIDGKVVKKLVYGLLEGHAPAPPSSLAALSPTSER